MARRFHFIEKTLKQRKMSFPRCDTARPSPAELMDGLGWNGPSKAIESSPRGSLPTAGPGSGAAPEPRLFWGFRYEETLGSHRARERVPAAALDGDGIDQERYKPPAFVRLLIFWAIIWK